MEKEKSEFYPNTEKDLNGYGATADNGQVKMLFSVYNFYMVIGHHIRALQELFNFSTKVMEIIRNMKMMMKIIIKIRKTVKMNRSSVGLKSYRCKALLL